VQRTHSPLRHHRTSRRRCRNGVKITFCFLASGGEKECKSRRKFPNSAAARSEKAASTGSSRDAPVHQYTGGRGKCWTTKGAARSLASVVRSAWSHREAMPHLTSEKGGARANPLNPKTLSQRPGIGEESISRSLTRKERIHRADAQRPGISKHPTDNHLSCNGCHDNTRTREILQL